MKQTEAHLKKFERFERENAQPAWVFPLRKAGLATFAERGFPTLEDEDWRFTNVAPISRLPFEPVFQPTPQTLSASQIQEFTFGKLDCIRLVFVNGHFSSELSTQKPAPSDVTIQNLSAALKGDTTLLQQHLARYARDPQNSFAALNTAFFQDGGYIYVPAGKTLETPVHFCFVTTTGDAGAALNPRNLILLGPNARATVLESYVTTVDAQYFTNSVTEIVLGDRAVAEHVKFQDESTSAFHIAALHSHLDRGSNLVAHSVATGARLSRNNIRTSLAGEGVECVLNGLYLTKDEQLADHHMIVEHASPHCNSHEYYNGILDGSSKGVFHGRILVRQIAQKTDAKQTNKNLLLSEDATVDTKPQLEIYADDVKCTHGATIGQLNEESIFYLRARGIGASTARQMLIHAFAGEIIERVRHRAVREELDQLIWDRLEAQPHLRDHA